MFYILSKTLTVSSFDLNATVILQKIDFFFQMQIFFFNVIESKF